MVALGLIAAGGRITADEIQQVAPLAVIKGSDESVTSSTTLQNDNELFVSVDANASYIFACYLNYEGGTTGSGDLKWLWALPAGATMRYAAPHINASSTTILDTTYTEAITVISRTNTAGTLLGVTMEGVLVTSSTAGTMQLTWAENTSDSTPTIIHAGSSLALWRIS
jgi:hypothetical protein